MDERLQTLPNPASFSFDRNGLRLAIAAIEDETKELHDYWSIYKRDLSVGQEDIRHELLDIAGCTLLALTGIP